MFLLILKYWSSEVLGSPKGGFEAVGDVDFFINIVNVALDRVWTDTELVSNLLVIGPASDMSEYLLLSGREGVRHLLLKLG